MELPPQPEFAHPVPLSEIGGKPVYHRLVADERQRAALARRFALVSLDALQGEVGLSRDEDGILALGSLTARVVQACVVSGAPVSADISEDFRVRFVPEASFAPDQEIELEEGDCDTLFHDGRVVDLGELLAQTLGLAINPYPRSPDADAALKAAGVKEAGEAGPFAALAALRKGGD